MNVFVVMHDFYLLVCVFLGVFVSVCMSVHVCMLMCVHSAFVNVCPCTHMYPCVTV